MLFKINYNRIKAERIAKGLTQEEVANALGYKNRATYAKRENGNVSIGADELAEIAYVLDVPIENLYIFYTPNVPENERKEQNV